MKYFKEFKNIEEYKEYFNRRSFQEKSYHYRKIKELIYKKNYILKNSDETVFCFDVKNPPQKSSNLDEFVFLYDENDNAVCFFDNDSITSVLTKRDFFHFMLVDFFVEKGLKNGLKKDEVLKYFTYLKYYSVTESPKRIAQMRVLYNIKESTKPVSELDKIKEECPELYYQIKYNKKRYSELGILSEINRIDKQNLKNVKNNIIKQGLTENYIKNGFADKVAKFLEQDFGLNLNNNEDLKTMNTIKLFIEKYQDFLNV